MEFKVGARVRGKGSGKLATIIAKHPEVGWWVLRYDTDPDHVQRPAYELDLLDDSSKPSGAEFKVGARFTGKRSGHRGTLVSKWPEAGFWTVRYDGSTVEKRLQEEDMVLVDDDDGKPKLEVGMIVTNKHESTEIRYRLIEESVYGNTPCWICQSVGSTNNPRIKFKAEDLTPVIGDEYGDSYTAKPQVKFLPSVDQSKPVVVAKDDFLAEAEKHIASLRLELDRATVEAGKWEQRYSEEVNAKLTFKVENTNLLAENARLRRALEKLERQKK